MTRYQALLTMAFFVSACADRWEGGGRRHDLPSDERPQEEPASGAPTDGGASSTDSPSDGGPGLSVGGTRVDDGTAGAGGLGSSEAAGAPPGVASAGTAGLPGLP
jgi:hypothetical protein